jgi:hypothetical protein
MMVDDDGCFGCANRTQAQIPVFRAKQNATKATQTLNRTKTHGTGNGNGNARFEIVER